MNGGAVQIAAQVSLGYNDFLSLGSILSSGIAESHGKSISSFLFIFKGKFILFSMVAAVIYIPTTSV